MDGEGISYTRLEELKHDWYEASLEACRSSSALDDALQTTEQKLTVTETASLNEQKREDVDVEMNVASSAVSFGASAIILETLLDVFSANAKKKTDDEEEAVIGTSGTSKANQREAQKSRTQSAALITRTSEKKKPKQESVFAGLMKNPDAPRLQADNIARQKALLGAQQRELQMALDKQANNTQTRNQLLAAKRQHQLKLERLGMVPAGMFSGPQMSSYKDIK